MRRQLGRLLTRSSGGGLRPGRSPFRVLKIAPTSFFADYGCHVRIAEEIVALRDQGVDVRLCCYPGGRDTFGIVADRALGLPWDGVRVGSSKHRFHLDALLTVKSLQVALRFRPDVIHGHLHEGALIGFPISRLLRVPLVFDFQGSLTSEMVDHNFLRRESLAYPPLRTIERAINHLPNVVITSSHNAADLLIDTFGCQRARVRAIPDAVNTSRFMPRWQVPERLRRQRKQVLGVPENSQVVVYLGLLAEYQGSGHLLRAAARICARRSDVHFLVMGYPGQDRYQSYAHQLGIANRITFTGRLPYEDAPLHLALGDIAVSPKISATEGNGKLLNYMAVGLPTVAYSTPVNREILSDLGDYATPGDEEELAARIETLLDNPAAAADRGRALRGRAEDVFSWEGAAHEIVKIYESLSLGA
jgi:glycosyltransferase involved in cell wall biosynthesis